MRANRSGRFASFSTDRPDGEADPDLPAADASRISMVGEVAERKSTPEGDFSSPAYDLARRLGDLIFEQLRPELVNRIAAELAVQLLQRDMPLRLAKETAETIATLVSRQIHNSERPPVEQSRPPIDDADVALLATRVGDIVAGQLRGVVGEQVEPVRRHLQRLEARIEEISRPPGEHAVAARRAAPGTVSVDQDPGDEEPRAFGLSPSALPPPRTAAPMQQPQPSPRVEASPKPTIAHFDASAVVQPPAPTRAPTPPSKPFAAAVSRPPLLDRVARQWASEGRIKVAVVAALGCVALVLVGWRVVPVRSTTTPEATQAEVSASATAASTAIPQPTATGQGSDTGAATVDAGADAGSQIDAGVAGTDSQVDAGVAVAGPRGATGTAVAGPRVAAGVAVAGPRGATGTAVAGPRVDAPPAEAGSPPNPALSPKNRAEKPVREAETYLSLRMYNKAAEKAQAALLLDPANSRAIMVLKKVSEVGSSKHETVPQRAP